LNQTVGNLYQNLQPTHPGKTAKSKLKTSFWIVQAKYAEIRVNPFYDTF
jgi:hypothetical protein